MMEQIVAIATVIGTVVAVTQLWLYLKHRPSASGTADSGYEHRKEQQPEPTAPRRMWHMISPWVLGAWQLFWLLLASTATDSEVFTAGEQVFFAVVLALNGLGAALGYQHSRRRRQLRSATKRGYVYLALSVLDFVLMIVLLVLSASGEGPQPAPQTTDKAETPTSGPTASQPPASPEELADALLAPADLRDLGRLVVLDQQSGTGAGVTSSGLTHQITYVSGDAACRAVVEAHPVAPEAWAVVNLADSPDPAKLSVNISEDIEAFASEAEAQRVMQQNLDQVVDCRSFAGDTEFSDGTRLRMTYRHRKISVPGFGEETIAHQIQGEAKDGTFAVWNFVEIRAGSDVVFIDYNPAERGEAHTEKIAIAAWSKYSRVR